MSGMKRSDLDEITARGGAARRDEFSFCSNPHYDVVMVWATVEHMFEWHDKACAWAAGWLQQDAGRDPMLTAKLPQHAW